MRIRSNATGPQRAVSNSADAKALRASKKTQKVTNRNMQLKNNVESGFVSCASSSSNSNDEINVSRLNPPRTSEETNDYVNFTNSKSFLKVDLKSAIYSRGYLSIWVKITYRIYEKISEKDWIGLYYIGELILVFYRWWFCLIWVLSNCLKFEWRFWYFVVKTNSLCFKAVLLKYLLLISFCRFWNLRQYPKKNQSCL